MVLVRLRTPLKPARLRMSRSSFSFGETAANPHGHSRGRSFTVERTVKGVPDHPVSNPGTKVRVVMGRKFPKEQKLKPKNCEF